MTLTQATAANLWLEPPADGTTLPVTAFLQKDGSGDWTIATTGQRDGALVDYQGTGDYELLDLTDEQYLVADGSDYTLSSTPPPIAILVDDGSGNPTISTTLTDSIAARFVHTVGGDVALYRDASPELLMLQSATGDVLCFEDN